MRVFGFIDRSLAGSGGGGAFDSTSSEGAYVARGRSAMRVSCRPRAGE
jgi:hypothetical protein